MAASARTRNDPRREATRIALIEAAERLFAQSGVEAVSIRQIGAAIGSLNTTVVGYHFGSKEALIEAVFLHRLPAIDARRAELVAQADVTGLGHDPHALVRAFALPLLEQTDASGQHSYARFLLGLERSAMLAVRARVIDDFPVTARLTERLSKLLPDELRREGHVRMRLIASMIASALQMIDQSADLTADAKAQFFDTTIAMAAAAFCALAPAGDAK